jgi:hypothetical protein
MYILNKNRFLTLHFDIQCVKLRVTGMVDNYGLKNENAKKENKMKGTNHIFGSMYVVSVEAYKRITSVTTTRT